MEAASAAPAEEAAASAPAVEEPAQGATASEESAALISSSAAAAAEEEQPQAEEESAAAPLSSGAAAAAAAAVEEAPPSASAASDASSAPSASAPSAPSSAAAEEPAPSPTYSATAAREAAAALPVYCPSDVARHSSQDDAWVSIAGVVFDVTPLLRPGGVSMASDAQLLLASAGTDVSRFFTPSGSDLRTFVDPVTNLVSPYLPSGRFPHIPPTATPTTGWAPPSSPPWWRNPALVVGRLTARARRIRVVNTLTAHEHLLHVGAEQTLAEIATKYLEYNAHAAGYTWKVLKPDYDSAILPLDMALTLEGNKVPDDSEEVEALGLDTEDNDLLPTVLLYYSDGLTIA